MTNFHYPLPESEPASPWSGLSDEARTALTKVAMGPSAASQLLNLEGGSMPELTPDFQTIVAEAHSRVVDLFAATIPSMSVPELQSSEFSQINWTHLQEGFSVYESLNMQPELLISPEGQPLDFWRQLYSGLRLWQDQVQPDAPHRLLKQSNGDGLFVADAIVQNWDSIKATSPGWKISVIAGTPKATALNVDHKGNDNTGSTASGLILGVPSANNAFLHSSAESYLTLQARRLFEAKEPVDTKIDGLYYFSWLDGTFTTTKDNKQVLAAPGGCWRPVSGRVFLVWDEVGARSGRLGARPEVRGQ